MESKKKIIRIPNPSEIFNDVYLPFALGEVKQSLLVFEGGRGSAKSREISQALVKFSLENKLRILLLRKVGDTVRDSQYRDIKDVTEDWGLSSEFTFLSSPLTIKNARGSEFICRGLDKATKIKSIANIDILWVEEAEELSKQDWIDLRLSIRGIRGDKQKRIIISFNRTAGNWTEAEFFYENGQFKEEENTYHLHTTYADNKFLDKPFLDYLDKMKIEDYEQWEKQALGLPIKLKGLVYTNWKVVDSFPENCKDIIYGLDFGYFPDPTVLLKIGRYGVSLYVEKLIYDYKLTNTDLIEKMKEIGVDKSIEMYADSAEPDRIEEISRSGYNVYPAEKGQGSVDWGIDVVKRYEINILSNSPEVRKDYESYKYKTKNGEVISPPTPAHHGSHSPDATRYPVATHWGKQFKLTMQDLKQVTTSQLETAKIKEGRFEVEPLSVSGIRSY